MVEFVSANPTGPLHVGHGRHAAFGASLANLLDAAGFDVYREYYINDAGRQMEILAASVWLRYLESFGEQFPFPSNGYRGDYLRPIASKLIERAGRSLHQPAAAVFANLPPDAPEGDKDAYIDAVIERAARQRLADVAGKGEAQVGHTIFRRRGRQMDALQMRRREDAGGLFEHFAHDRLQQRLAAIEVTGRVVEHQAAIGRAFFDQQVAAVG